jgi:hypothetical protein
MSHSHQALIHETDAILKHISAELYALGVELISQITSGTHHTVALQRLTLTSGYEEAEILRSALRAIKPLSH